MTDISAALGPAKKTKTAQNRPLGLFGGRFDPVHRAHIKIAQAVADQLKLDEIRWIVTGDPVHKPAVASSHHRLAMVQLALEALNDQRMRVDDREIIAAQHGAKNYSADTVKTYQTEFPNRSLILILGADQLQDFPTWSRWQWLIENVELAVCSRPGTKSSTAAKLIESLGGVIHWVFVEPDDISSTEIRKQIRFGHLSANLLPKSIEHYIQKNRIY